MYNFGITSKHWDFIFVTCRCQRWLQASRCDDPQDKSTEYLSANCRLCADYFEPSQFMNSQMRNQLVWNAVPKVFQIPNPPKRIDGGRKPPTKRKIAADPRLPTSVAKWKEIQSKNGGCFVFYKLLYVCIGHT
jgi:THAP domain